MDALSHALAGIRLTSPLLARLKLGDDCALEIGDYGWSHLCPFHYVSSGQCRVVVGSASTLELKKGDMILLPRCPFHCIETGDALTRFDILDTAKTRGLPVWSPAEDLDEPSIIEVGQSPVKVTLLSGVFVFKSSQTALLLRNLPDWLRIDPLQYGIEDLLRAALIFVDANAIGRPGYAATATRLLEVLLVEALRIWVTETDHTTGLLRGIMDATLSQALNAIHMRPGHPWTVKELAAVAGRSRSGFAEHFTAVIGTPPAAYLADWRFQLAEERLATSDVSIKALADELGYDSSFAFSRAFRNRRGVTPARFRRERHVPAFIANADE
jgi:AraC-like DNA-binding protein